MAKTERQRRRWWFSLLMTSSVFLALGSLLLSARALIMPCALAAGLAYLCKPLVYSLRRSGWPSWAAVTTIATTLIVILFVSVRLAVSALPTGTDRTEKIIEANHRLNLKVEKLLRISTAQEVREPHWVYRQFGPEVDYIMTRINTLLKVSDSDLATLKSHFEGNTDPRAEKITALIDAYSSPQRWQASANESALPDENAVQKHISSVVSSFTVWLLFPILFFFLLGDNGSIFRFSMGFIPNRYFELILTMLERVDRALGRYLRGTAMECFLVGLVIGAGLFVFGVTLPFAIIIGLISGITNAIPFVGTMVGLVLGFGYALMVDDIQPLLPFLSADDLLWGVIAAVTVAHLLDNAVFQPLLVGKAVNLHPIVIILAVATGGMVFGLIGILAAIPTVVVINTCLGTLVAGLKDYRLI